MPDSLLNVNIVTGPVIIAFFAVSAAALIYLLARRPTPRWIVTAAIGLLGGAVIGLATLLVTVGLLNLFGSPLSHEANAWIIAAFAAIGLAIVNLWRSRWWRKLIAVVGILLFGITATLGVNAAYGLNPTLGSFLHINTSQPIDPGKPPATPPPANAGPLWETWTPPADMPAAGKTGTVDIPATASGFSARAAELYLPPAAQVDNAPALPFVLMMMGQPGDPDAQYIAAILDKYAAANKGLAPIALIVDQLGDPANDPLCLDSSRGNVETYVMTDAVGWAKANLNILPDRTEWTVAGYSNGGECSAYFGSKYPDVWGNILDISGDAYAGAEDSDQVLKEIFGGDQAAYDAVKPVNILAAGSYPDTTAIFTVGADDGTFQPDAKAVSDAAAAAGMNTTYYEVPGGDHGVSALNGGLDKGFELLYPRLGLSQPAS
ncbi:alpha/beta hydrolase [Glaciibacter superstes]|uniref:alpha/beta hydrolase n=1 Tax=Glaciibacter superstes TaxID=501023 RepID=UPI0003B5427D|nr:esterase [Glaciibacter superstes]